MTLVYRSVKGSPLTIEEGEGNIEHLDENKVNNTGDESIAGIKTFTSIPVFPASDPSTDNQGARKKYVDDKISDTVYGSGWNGVTAIAPSKNAVYDKFESVIASLADYLNIDGSNAMTGDLDLGGNGITSSGDIDIDQNLVFADTKGLDYSSGSYLKDSSGVITLESIGDMNITTGGANQLTVSTDYFSMNTTNGYDINTDTNGGIGATGDFNMTVGGLMTLESVSSASVQSTADSVYIAATGSGKYVGISSRDSGTTKYANFSTRNLTDNRVLEIGDEDGQVAIINDTPVSLVDSASMDLTSRTHTLTTSSATRTFTISYIGNLMSIEVTLNTTSSVFTFPVSSLCISEGVSSGDNTCTLSGTSGDKYLIEVKKVGSNYYVAAKNWGQ